MVVIIDLPIVGESVVEGVIGKWLKQPGDRLERYDPLVEVVTDKVTMEVPSPCQGILSRILVAEGTTVPMGAPIAEGETDEATGPCPEDAPPLSHGIPLPVVSRPIGILMLLLFFSIPLITSCIVPAPPITIIEFMLSLLVITL